ncbi:hypothetical protein GC194_03800 [bacterium]|nr:hypothetical protein [bacterium]
MDNKQHIADELKELSPLLSQMKSREGVGFNDLPTGYFERTKSELKNELLSGQNRKPYQKWGYLFAAIAAALALVWLVKSQQKDQLSYPPMAGLTENEALVIDEMDSYDMEFLLTEQEYIAPAEAEELLLQENHLEDLLNL